MDDQPSYKVILVPQLPGQVRIEHINHRIYYPHELIGLKTVTKGVKVQFADEKIVVDVIITVVYGCNIVEVAKEVQDKVMSLVQASTGIEHAEVNVHVSGISFDR